MRLSGPDDIELLIEPYPDGYTWSFRNRSSEILRNIGFEIRRVRCFDAEKSVFLDASTTFRAHWTAIHRLSLLEQTKGVIFLAIEAGRLRFGQTTGTNWVPWPDWDQAPTRRWLLNMCVVGLSKEWPIEFDMRWTPGTKTVELELSSEAAAQRIRTGGERRVSDSNVHRRRDFLESLSPDDPNYAAAKRFHAEGWADSHALVADALSGKISLTELLNGCVRTFEQSTQLHVAAENTGSPTAKCREIDRMTKRFIQKVSDSLAKGAAHLGPENLNALINDFSDRVREIAARSKQRVFLKAMGRHAPKSQVVAEAFGDSRFWTERRVEFANYAVPLAKLHAFWKGDSRVWFLWSGAEAKGIVPEEHKETLNAIARKAVTKIPRSATVESAEPWQRWLDFMRRNEWAYRVTGNVACTEREWDLGVKDGKPLVRVRSEQGYTTGDEWTEVYRRTKAGKLQRLKESELKGKSSGDLQKYYHWLENGSIEHVFEASTGFCEELASRAFELEAAEHLPDGSTGKGKSVREPLADKPLDAMPPAIKGDVTQQRLGVRLKRLKTESNLTWDTIAKESGVSRRWLLDVSSGRRPSAATRKVVEDYFSRVLKRRIRL